MVTAWLDLGEQWVLCLDRTNGQVGREPINLLVVSVVYQGVSVPLLWMALDKQGNSATKERQALMERFLARFPVARIAGLPADRECRGHQW